MEWTTDDTGRFRIRPYYTEEEIDGKCEYILENFFRSKGNYPFKLPIKTEDFTVLIETVAESLELYAALPSTINGETDFSPNQKPIVKINKDLSENPRQENRLRSTLTHEFFHAKFHQPLWQNKWSKEKSTDTPLVSCHRENILTPKKTDWLEWQAAYGSGAFLMPRSLVYSDFEEYFREQKIDLEEYQTNFVSALAKKYQVSLQAVKVRLSQLIGTSYLESRART